MSNKPCSQCGRSFSCGRNEPSCWCSDLPALASEQLDASADCLCPHCLSVRLAVRLAVRPAERPSDVADARTAGQDAEPRNAASRTGPDSHS